MGAVNLQSYWQQASLYLALTVFSLLILNWAIICALAEPALKAKLRKIALADAIFFTGVPLGFYFLAPYAGDIMAALGTAIAHFRDFVSLVHISIGVGLLCYLIVSDFVFLGESAEAGY